jgi:hypothetical protein
MFLQLGVDRPNQLDPLEQISVLQSRPYAILLRLTL